MIDRNNPSFRHGEIPAGQRVYAFGDVHGRDDLLLRLKAAIREDMKQRPPASIIVVGLGDVVDRGPSSAQAVETLREGFEGVAETVLLLGNHEEMMLSFLDGLPGRANDWLSNGASQTLLSFGLAPLPSPLDADPHSLRRRFRDALSEDTLSFVRGWRRSVSIGGYFFSHAGARPGIPLKQQSPADLVWHRHASPDDDPPFEKVVVHGHTPVTTPFMGRNRINLDTGAVFSDRLSLIALEGAERRLLAV